MVRFLIIRFSSIGDIILTTPVVRHLKTQVEDAEIHYLTKTSYACLLEDNPYVDRIHSLNGDLRSTIRELKELHFDYLIDLHHNTRSARVKLGLKRMDFSVRKLNLQKWLLVNFRINRLPDLHMVDRNLETITTFIEKQDKKGLDYFIPSREEVALSGLPEAFREGYIGLAIGAQHATKKLPTDMLVSLCEKLNKPVVILGGPADRDTGENIIEALPHATLLNTCGQYNIHQSASLVRQCNVLITHDTGLMHIAAALGKKIISIWGNTIPAFGMYPYRTDPSSSIFEVEDLHCRPCSKIGHQKCPKKHFHCMLNQDLDGIALKAEELYWATNV